LPNCNKKTATQLETRSSTAFLNLALLLPIIFVALCSVAQVVDTPRPTQQPHHAHRRPTLADRVKAIAKSLDLSEPQQAAVTKILEQRQQETLRIRQNTSISGSARIDQFRALQDNTVERIRAVLNEEQKKKYDPLAVRRIEPAPEQKSVEDWLKVTTPE
jgi:Spy/CpxP family protein refolding chaperone